MNRVKADKSLFQYDGAQGSKAASHILETGTLQNRAVLSILEAEIATHANNIFTELTRHLHYEDDSRPFDSIESYINSMKIDVPVGGWDRGRVVTESVVREMLDRHGFVAENLVISIHYRKRRWLSNNRHYCAIRFSVRSDHKD